MEAKPGALTRSQFNVLYCISASLIPNVPLFFLYNQNTSRIHVAFGHVLVLAGAVALTGLLLYLFFKYISANIEGALLLSLAFWLCFWFFDTIFGMFKLTWFGSATTFILFFSVLFGICFLLRRFKESFEKKHIIFDMLAIIIIPLFIFNITPGILDAHTLYSARGKYASEYIKTDFIVDPDLPKPDIYWLHLDGMMSLETMERFWVESMEHVREEVANRGFLIYQDATLNAGFTDAALPAILSPAFYDRFWGARLAEAETKLRFPRQDYLATSLLNAGMTYSRHIVPNYELFEAFNEAGYDIWLMGHLDGFLDGRLPHKFNYFRMDEKLTGIWRLFAGTGDLLTLLLTTPFKPLLETEYSVTGETPSFDYSRQGPSLTYHTLLYTHMFFAWQYNDLDGDVYSSHLYPSAYEIVSRIMLELVDDVLSENPNTVIVLLADHGFHMMETQEHMLEQGYSMEEVLEMIHSVFAAVYIPPEYGGLDAPIAPLNVSRELINRYVGENYTLLESDGR